MSQAGIVDFEGSHPQVPTSFITNMGTAVPIANTLEILGTTVAAHSIPLETTGSGNTVTVVAQYASATASTGTTAAGLASFNSADFTVDANGYVSTAVPAIESFQVDTFTAPGTNPVVPNISGVVTITGGQVAAGTTSNVIQTDSLAASTYTIQIQRSQAVAVSTVGDNGVSHFNSSYFTVDSNGFVSISGTAIGQKITGNVGGSLSPVAGNWNILGTSTASGTTPVQTSGSGNTLTVQVQTAQAIASTNATNIGLAAFNSATFSVDANGFVSLNGSAVGETITGNSGGAISPSAGNWNTLGTGSITIAGSGSTLTTQLTGLTNHAVLVGAGTATITKVGPSSSTGQVLQNNAAADPSYSTATYPSTTTANQLLYSSATNTIGGLTGANSASLVSTSTGAPIWSSSMTNGQVILGSTGATPAAGTIGSSDGSITWTVGAGTLTGQVTGGTTAIKTITGNDSVAESPSAGNFNILGTGSITTTGSAATETISLTGLTNHAVLVGAGTATITKVGPSSTTGQILQNNAAADPSYSTATYPSTATSTGTILRADGTNWSATTATYPNTTTANQILYSSATNTIGGLSTANDGVLVTSNIGVPSILVGPGTTGNILQSNASAAPSFSSATYPSSTTANQLLYSSATNTVSGLTAANSASLVSTSAGVPVWSSTMTNGQVIIGSTSATPTAATLTAGTGISITNGAGAITINSSGGSVTWSDNSGTFTAAANNGYFITAASTPTLPASPSVGTVVKFFLDAAATVTITANTGQVIRVDGNVSASAGTAATSTRGNSLSLVFRSTNNQWCATDVIGTWTIT